MTEIAEVGLRACELSACPFCGGEANLSAYETESLWSHAQVTYTQVGCSGCDIAFSSEPGMEPDAITAWNDRQPDPRVSAMIAALKSSDAMAIGPNGSGGSKVTINFADCVPAGKLFAALSDLDERLQGSPYP